MIINPISDTISFYTSHFQSKWGFDDGDFGDDGYDIVGNDIGISYDRDDFAKFLLCVLSKMVTSNHEFYYICSCHNQVRTSNYEDIKPEVITLKRAEFVEIMGKIKSGEINCEL